MSRKRWQGHLRRHEYGGGKPQKKRQSHSNGRGREHYAPKYPTLAEGQKDPAIKNLLDQRFARLTVTIYGPRLAGTFDFEDQDNFTAPRPPQDDRDPLETFGRIYAGDIFVDLFAHGFVCTGAKYRSRDDEECGDGEGKNYLFFQRRSDIRLDNKTGKKYYLRPHWADYIILQADLARQNIKKVQLLFAQNNRGGIKHTLKLFTGPSRGGQLEKPVWNATSREWVLKPTQRPSQQPAQ